MSQSNTGQINAGLVDLVKVGDQMSANRTSAPEVIKFEDGKGSFVLYDKVSRSIIPGEEILKNRVTPPVAPRCYEAFTIDSLAEMTRSLSKTASVMVLASMDEITVLLDEADRRDSVFFTLKISETWKRVRVLGIGQKLGQRALRDLLRRDMDALYEPANIVSIISAVKFTGNTQGAASVDVGKFAVSKSTTAEITGTGDLPESIMATSLVWENARVREKDYSATVRISLDADPMDQTFTLKAMAGNVPLREMEALDWLVENLRMIFADMKNVNVFAGADQADE